MFCRAGKWFVAFSCEVEKPEPLPKTGESIGVDLGLLRLATLSNGEKKENPRWYRKILQELRVLQRKIARCMRGGRNRRRLVLRLQRLMVHVADARKDFLNKFVHELITRFDRIVLEDLRVAAMAHGRFAMSILDAGWSYLVSRLAHKAQSAGREVVKVDPAYTSKTCSGCGAIFEHLSLSDRWVECDCGVSLDRDHNAAIVVFQRGRNGPLAPNSPMGGFAQKPHDFSRGGVFTCQVDWSQERNASVTVVRSVLVVDWSSTAPVRSTANRTSADREPAWPARLFPFVASPAGRYFSARAGVAEWQTLRT